MTPLIAILDDEAANVERWQARLTSMPGLRDEFDIQGMTDFRKDVDELERRRSESRTGRQASRAETLFDAADIALVDYDLIGLGADYYLTGETVAYLARCYSQCSVIVVMNQFGENPFDLTLRGHPSSFADLNLGSRQIANPALWGFPTAGFHPWAWPDLRSLRQSFVARVDKLLVDDNLDQPIANLIGLPRSVIEILPRGARESLEGKGDPESTTWRQFVEHSTFALRRKDAVTDDLALARIAAARVFKWMERLVLPEQDVLVDAPHLVARYPSLLSGSELATVSWDRAASGSKPAGSGILAGVVDRHRLPGDLWTSRPVWFGKDVAADNSIAEVADPWSRKSTSLTFCEDLSRFLARSATREFVADVDSPHVRRFVADPDDPSLADIAEQLRNVDYRPAVRFSL